MRMMLIFEKGKRLRHIGHLDLLRTMQRALRRSGLPIAFSQGFNPHVLVAIASPLSVGVWGKREIMEATLCEDMVPSDFIEALRPALPADIRAVTARPMAEDHPALMAQVAAAAYTATLQGSDGAALAAAIPDLLARGSIDVIRKTKKGDKPCDIRPMIYQLEAKPGGDETQLHMVLALREAATCKPSLLLDTLAEQAGIEPPSRAYSWYSHSRPSSKRAVRQLPFSSVCTMIRSITASPTEVARRCRQSRIAPCEPA